MLKLEELCIDNLKIYQDDSLYCFTSDAVLLSRFAISKPNDNVADFCSGSGIVGLNFYALNKENVNNVSLIEMQKPLFELSKKTIQYNGLTDKFFLYNMKVQEVPEKFNQAFSMILCNPPYIKKGCGYKTDSKEIEICKTEQELSLEELMYSIKVALKNGGRLNICHRADRICDLLCEMRKNKIEPKKIQFVLSGKNAKTPYLVLVEGVKGAKPSLKVLENIIN